MESQCAFHAGRATGDMVSLPDREVPKLHCVSEKNVTLFTFTINSSDVGRFS